MLGCGGGEGRSGNWCGGFSKFSVFHFRTINIRILCKITYGTIGLHGGGEGRGMGDMWGGVKKCVGVWDEVKGDVGEV